MSTTNQPRYAPNTIGEEEFVQAVSEMAREVWDFHNRWGFGSGHFEDTSPANIIDRRKAILAEEVANSPKPSTKTTPPRSATKPPTSFSLPLVTSKPSAPKALTASDTSPPKTQTKPSKPTQFGKTLENCCRKKANHTSGSDPAIPEEL